MFAQTTPQSALHQKARRFSASSTSVVLISRALVGGMQMEHHFIQTGRSWRPRETIQGKKTSKKILHTSRAKKAHFPFLRACVYVCGISSMYIFTNKPSRSLALCFSQRGAKTRRAGPRKGYIHTDTRSKTVMPTGLGDLHRKAK